MRYLFIFAVLLFAFASAQDFSEFAKDNLSPIINEEYTNTLVFENNVYKFQHAGATLDVTYTLDIAQLEASKGLLSVGCELQKIQDSSSSFHTLTSNAGPMFWVGNACVYPTGYPSYSVSLTHSRSSSAVTLEYRFTFTNVYNTVVRYEFSLKGRSLQFHAFNPNTTQTLRNWCGFFLGPTRNTPNAKRFELPYLPEPLVYFEGLSSSSLYWSSVYIDRLLSNGYTFNNYYGNDTSDVATAYVSSYSVDSTNTYQPLDETGYITVSDNIENVLPYPQSYAVYGDYYQDQKQRSLVDLWGPTDSSLVTHFEPVWSWEIKCPGACTINANWTAGDNHGLCGDGVILSVYRDTELLWAYIVQNNQTSITGNIQVDLKQATSNSFLRFRVAPGTSMSCDSTLWAITITSSANPSITYSNNADWNSTQGYNNWYYQYATSGDSTYTPMTWNGTRWAVAGDYPIITRGGCHPATKFGALLALDAHRRYITNLGEWGMTNLSIIVHNWQMWGYDVKFPELYPANPALGGSDSMIALITAAKKYGNLISLHENYVDMYPDSPMWNFSMVAFANNGPKLAWLNRGTGQQSLKISNEHSLELAIDQQSKIAPHYAPNAGYEDVDTSENPAISANLNASTRVYPPTTKVGYYLKKQLWNQFRKSYNGPFFGEGREKSRTDVYFAPYVDGAEAQIEGKNGAALTPEYAQHVVKNLQFMQGMGYFSRWHSTDNVNIVFPVSLPALLDQYRLQQIIFANIGWLSMGTGKWGRPTLHDTLAEYHLMKAIQFLQHTEKISSIGYVGAYSGPNPTFQPLAQFLHSGGDPVNPVINLTYTNNLTVIANGRQETLWAHYVIGGGLEYTNEFNAKGFSQWSFDGTSYVPMVWNPVSQVYSARYLTSCRISGSVFFPGTSCHPILVWTPPEDPASQPIRYENIVIALVSRLWGNSATQTGTTYRFYEGDFSQANTSTASWNLLHNVTSMNFTEINPKIFNLSSLAPGRSLILVVNGSVAGSQHTFSIGATKILAAGKTLDALTSYNGKQYTLPTNGFLAYSKAWNYLAHTSRQSDGGLVDYTSSNFSIFARSRDKTVRTIESLQVDGTVAFVPNAFGGEDVFFTEVTALRRDAQSILRASARVTGFVKYTSRAALSVALSNPVNNQMYNQLEFFELCAVSGWVIPADADLSLFSVALPPTNFYPTNVSLSLSRSSPSSPPCLRFSDILDQQTVTVSFSGTLATPSPTPSPTSPPSSSSSSTTTSSPTSSSPSSSATTGGPVSGGTVVRPQFLLALFIFSFYLLF